MFRNDQKVNQVVTNYRCAKENSYKLKVKHKIKVKTIVIFITDSTIYRAIFVEPILS